MTGKAPDAFRTISEAAKEIGLPAHVLRHWEDTFGAIRPMRRAGGRRYYRLYDLELLNGVRALLHGERYTTKGVQKIFKDQGAQFVASIGREVMAGFAPEQAVATVLAAESPSPTPNGNGHGGHTQNGDLPALLTQLKSLKQEISALRAASDNRLI